MIPATISRVAAPARLMQQPAADASQVTSYIIVHARVAMVKWILMIFPEALHAAFKKRNLHESRR